MGADLICFIVKGPDQIPDKAKIKANEQAAAMWAMLQIWDQENAGTFKDYLNKRYGGQRPTAFNTDSLDDDTEFSDVEHLRHLPPSEWVTNFIKFWNEDMRDRIRDINWRNDPDDPSQFIVVAGELSWGEEPEGIGYTSFKNASLLGILGPLGIR